MMALPPTPAVVSGSGTGLTAHTSCYQLVWIEIQTHRSLTYHVPYIRDGWIQWNRSKWNYKSELGPRLAQGSGGGGTRFYVLLVLQVSVVCKKQYEYMFMVGNVGRYILHTFLCNATNTRFIHVQRRYTSKGKTDEWDVTQEAGYCWWATTYCNVVKGV